MSSSSKYDQYTFDSEGDLIENPLYIPELRETRLIQRFKFREDNHLSPDYMGSYEFEVADIRSTLERVVSGIQDDSYSMVSLSVFGPPEFPLGSCGRMGIDWFDLGTLQERFVLEASILVFCPNRIRAPMEEFFRELAFEDEVDRRLQERSYLRYSLFSKLEWDFEGADRAFSPMHPDALLDLDHAVLVLLTEPCARHFCRTFNVPFIEGSVQSADFTEVDEALQLLQQRNRLRESEQTSAKKKKRSGRIPV